MNDVCPNGHALSNGLCVAYKCEKLGGEETPSPIVYTAESPISKLLRTRPSTPQERFSVQLKKTRKLVGLKQRQIAQNMNITQSTYSKWERSRLLPNAIQMRVLLEIFGNTSAFENVGPQERYITDLEDAYKVALANSMFR